MVLLFVVVVFYVCLRCVLYLNLFIKIEFISIAVRLYIVYEPVREWVNTFMVCACYVRFGMFWQSERNPT